MPKIVRISFNRGILGTAEPRVAGDGYASVIHNVDMRSGVIRPMRVPTPASGLTLAQGYSWSNAAWLFEYRGTWYPTPGITSWAAETVGTMTRVYKATGDAQAMKCVNGTWAKLGTPAPQSPPVVTQVENATGTISVTATEVVDTTNLGSKQGSTYSFRVLNRDARGRIIGAGESGTVTYSSTNSRCQVNWTNLTGAVVWELYCKGPDDKQFYFIRSEHVQSGSLSAQFGSNKPEAYEDYTRPWPGDEDNRVTPVYYVYTNVRDVNGHEDESGPSPVSEACQMGYGRKVVLEPIGSSGFKPGASYPSPVATQNPGGASIPVVSLSSMLGRTVLACSAAHGLHNGDVVYVSQPQADGETGTFTVSTVQDPSPFSASQITWTVNSTLGAGSGGTYLFRFAKLVGCAFPNAEKEICGHSSASGNVGPITITGDQWVQFTLPLDNAIDGIAMFVSSDNGATWQWFGFPAVGNGDGKGNSAVIMFNYANATVGLSPFTGGQPWASSNVASNCFSLSTTSVWKGLFSGLSGRSGPLTVTGGAGVLISVNASLVGFNNGERRTVKLSGFGTNNQHLNSTFIATITDAAQGKFTINSYVVSPPATGSSAVFAQQVAGASSDDIAFVKRRNIYRVGDSTEYLFVASVPPDVTTYVDTVPTEDLGRAIPTFYSENGVEVIFAPPPTPDDSVYDQNTGTTKATPSPYLSSIVHAGGMLFGISGNQVLWTPVGFPDAWPRAFQVTLPTTPLRLIPHGGSIIILCYDSIWRLEVASPTAVSLQKTMSEAGCVAPYSAAVTPKGIVYLAADGLMIFDAARNTSYPLFPNRLGRRFFLAPSTPTSAFGHWWLPMNKTFAYTYLTSDYPPVAPDKNGLSHGRSGLYGQLANNPTYPSPFTPPRGFYTNGKYFLYYSTVSAAGGDPSYCHHGMLEVDLDLDPPVAKLHGLKPIAAWVTAEGNAYLLLPGASADVSKAISLEGALPDDDSGVPAGGLNYASPSMYKMWDDLGQKGLVGLRTGPIHALIHERVLWRQVEVHGTGTGRMRVWVDGVDVTSTQQKQYAAFVASETPTHARRVPLPRGTQGYTIDIELTGALDPLVALEITFSPLGES